VLTSSYDIAMLRLVRLTAAPDIAELLVRRPQMEWDAGNSTKSETNYLLLGVTSGGRHAALIFTRRGEKLRPISCHAMRNREKDAYDAAT